MQRVRMIPTTLEAVETQMNMKTKLSKEITYVMIDESLDDNVIKHTVRAPMTSSTAWTITKGAVKSVLDKLIDE